MSLSSRLACFRPECVVLGFARAASVRVKQAWSARVFCASEAENEEEHAL